VSRYLLDSHIFLWWLSDADRLEKKIYDIISDSKNQIYISAATIWEIAIKEALGKLKVDTNLSEAIKECGFIELKLSAKCADFTKKLPHIHKDPFDRMLISQAMQEDLILISADRFIKEYDNVKVHVAKKNQI